MRGRRRLLVLVLLVAGAVAFGCFRAWPFWSSLVVERRLKRAIAQADRITVLVPPQGVDLDDRSLDPRAVKMEETRVTDPAEVARLKRELLERPRRSGMDPPSRSDKCFDAWERLSPYDVYPHVIFSAPGRRVTVWLPEGDCQVWVEGLPWGWQWTNAFIDDAYRLAGRR